MQINAETLKLIGFSPTGDLGTLTAYTSARHGTVWFNKSPPMKPPSDWQRKQRNRFRLAAQAWSELDDVTQSRWHLACRRARLYIHGYNLWMFWQLTRARARLATIERQSGIQLV